MPTGQYPFIDIAVHDKVRDHYVAGEAVVVFSQSLDTILWVNGAGARLFGHDGLYEFMDEGLSATTPAFRQLQSASRNILRSPSADACNLVMRTGKGFRRPLTSARLQKIVLADGNNVFLLTAPMSEPATTAGAQAACILDGFEEMDTHAAVLDRDGAILVATRSFDHLHMDASVRARIVDDVSDAHDRLVKHPVRTALGLLPAAIARVSDEPALHLLFAVEMSIGNLDPQPAEPVHHEDEPDLPLTDVKQLAAKYASEEPTPDTPVSEEATPEEPAADDGSHSVFETTIEPPEEPVTPITPIPSVLNMVPDTIVTPGSDHEGEHPPIENDDVPYADATREDEETAEPLPKLSPSTPIAEDDTFVFNPQQRPSRFVWKIDADGVFSEISAEFANAVGPNAADVEGRKFTDVAQVFNIDADHTISDLLRKRDTWSGKSVLWPVQGTDLCVPVDLAALPTYSRDREFDGFRGFGIVRAGDAQSDPEKIGMALISNPQFGRTSVADELPVEEEPHSDRGATSDAEPDAPSLTSAGEEPADLSITDDGSKNEKPALKIAQTPNRRQTDKVIQLEERRSKSRDGLSQTEKQAFREIAARLNKTRDEADEAVSQPFGKRKLPPVNPDAASNLSGQTGLPPVERDEAADAIDPSNDLPPIPVATDASPDLPRETGKPEPGAEPQRANGVTAAILEQLPTPVVVHDGTLVYYINEEFRLLTGILSKAELNQSGGVAALFEDSNDNDEDIASSNGNLSLRCANGETVAVRVKLRSIGWEDGNALMLALTLAPPPAEETDGTVDHDLERVESATHELLDNEANAAKTSALQVEVDELRSILETATDGVVLLDQDGIMRSMNHSASALFDYDDSETNGKPFAMLFAHESQRAVKDYLSGLTGNGVASVLNDGREVIGREASGGFLPLFMTIGRLTGSNGYCAVMRDITQWKRAEEELRTAKREAETASAHKSDFLARVSHEIRTPLNAIIGFSELMAAERFGPMGSPRYVEYAHDIGRSGNHVLDIVNDLLDISKIEAGEQELDFGAVSLNNALLETVSILQPQANSQRVIVRTSLSSSVPDVVADLRSIKQIAINILSNAIRFTPAGGQIVVSTAYEPNGSVFVRIRDTGVGMTRHQLEQAMKPFKQVDGSQQQRGDGTGLGLPLAKAMAEANRAQFAMNSQPGQGTLVEIVFPSQRVLAQ